MTIESLRAREREIRTLNPFTFRSLQSWRRVAKALQEAEAGCPDELQRRADEIAAADRAQDANERRG